MRSVQLLVLTFLSKENWGWYNKQLSVSDGYSYREI